MAFAMSQLKKDGSTYIPEANDHLGMVGCHANNKKDVEREEFPMHPDVMQKYQQMDKRIHKLNLDIKKIEGTELRTTKEGKIYIPAKLCHRIIAWYHLYLRHPGLARLEHTL